MNKFTVLSEKGRMLIEHQYTSWQIGKGGKPILWSTTTKISKHEVSKIPSFMLLAKATCDDWYLGHRSTIQSVVVREGLYEYDVDAEKLTIIEEMPTNWHLSGNGEGIVEAYTKEAAEYLEAIQWPNGRKCYNVKRAF